MKSFFLSLVLFIILDLNLYSQTTYYPKIEKSNLSNMTIDSITLTPKKTYVFLTFIDNRSYSGFVTMDKKATIFDRNTGYQYGIKNIESSYKAIVEDNTITGYRYKFVLIFQPIPSGATLIDINENIGDGWKCEGISIINPDNSPKTNWDETSLKLHWKNKGFDQFEGIYESILSDYEGDKLKYALKRDIDRYELIYIDVDNKVWKTGDIKAFLYDTGSPNVFKVKWLLADKLISEQFYITLSSSMLEILLPNSSQKFSYLKLYPTAQNISNNPKIGNKASGSAFALSSDGFICTNYHVIENASKIQLRGVKGNMSKVFNAKVVISDKTNDLAILKIEDSTFTNLGIIPFTIQNLLCNVGDAAFVLGYPYINVLGEEVKLTNGIISSKTGFKGDITSYQISVPIQPGNSGGPMFNSNGDIVGIVNAKFTAGENVSYAIKSKYLFNLIQEMDNVLNLPKLNNISNMSLSDQVKYIKEFVYILEIEY